MSFDALSYESGRGSNQRQSKRLFDRLQKGEEQAVQMQDDILYLKKRLAGVVAVKDALKDALAAVAPDHPLVNPTVNNPLLVGVYQEAANRVTSADDVV